MEQAGKEVPQKEGWTWLINSTKWHYFVNSKSLCGKWMILADGDLVERDLRHTDLCRRCKRSFIARQAKAGNEKQKTEGLD